VVVAVIYCVYWVLKQVKSSREERASGTGLASIATLPLGQGRALHMVRAGSEVVLVGVGEHGVTPIRTYGRHEAEAAGLLDQIADEADSDGWHAAALDGLSANGGLRPADKAAPVGNAAPGAAGQPAFATPGEALRRGVDALRQRTVRR
jgi:flagellar biogenesis protein FliO